MSVAVQLAAVLDPGRSALTGPLALVTVPDPGHWLPRPDEPLYAQLYAERRGQLAAGLGVTLPAPTSPAQQVTA